MTSSRSRPNSPSRVTGEPRCLRIFSDSWEEGWTRRIGGQQLNDNAGVGFDVDFIAIGCARHEALEVAGSFRARDVNDCDAPMITGDCSCAVVDFVAGKAPRSHRNQQGTAVLHQAIQSKALIFDQFQQTSIKCKICFGSRGSGVRIPPPRPLYSRSGPERSFPFRSGFRLRAQTPVTRLKFESLPPTVTRHRLPKRSLRKRSTGCCGFPRLRIET